MLTEREEKNSVAIASNDSFGSWTRTFTDPRLCAAIVDRLTFAGQIIETGTVSYRLAHARQQHNAKKAASAPARWAPPEEDPMPAPQAHLDLADAAELAELLTFISQWLGGTDHAQLAASFSRFIGTPGYDLTELRTDLARFTFLLGHDDGEQLFGTGEN